MINFYCPMNHLGYGVHSFNLMRSLDALGIELTLYTPNNKIDLNESIIEKWIKNQNQFKADDAGVMIFHEQSMNKFWGKPRIGFPVFEVGLFKQDVEKLKTLDFILQTCDWYKDYLNNIGFNNVHVVPEGYDEQRYNMDNWDVNKKIELLNKEGLIFSHVGKFEERKNSRNILKVFTYALENCNMKCTLIAHMFNMFEPKWLELITNYVNALGYTIAKEKEEMIIFIKNNLRIMIPKFPMKDIREIYASSHFGIYLSRAEGWNLPLMESIACGTPCITTTWTGMSAYINENYPIDLTITKGAQTVAYDGIWFLGDRGDWIDPDLSQVKNALRFVAQSPEKYLRLSKSCANSIKDFTWINSAKKFINIMQTIGVLNKEN